MRTRASLVAASVLVAVVVGLDHRSNVGAIVVLAFLAVAPGAALVRLLGFPSAGERVVTLVVILGVSFAIDALVAEAMVYAARLDARARVAHARGDRRRARLRRIRPPAPRRDGAVSR